MDAMAVAGKGGVAEQEHRVRQDVHADSAGRGWRGSGGGFDRSAFGATIDDVLLLFDREAVRACNVMTDGDEDEAACAAVLLRDVEDGARSLNPVASAEGRVEADAAAGPHASGQVVHGRQKPPRRGWPSGPRPGAATQSWNSIQCQSGGSVSGIGRFKVAARPCRRRGDTSSAAVCWRPI